MTTTGTPVKKEESSNSFSAEIENHTKAAEHHEAAAKHHRDAAKHYEMRNYEKACENMAKAKGLHCLASAFQREDVKFHTLHN